MSTFWTGQDIKVLLQLVGRLALPEEKVKKIILGNRKIDTKSKKYLSAYNLSDGTLTLGEIAKKAGIDTGNFSRIAARWTDAGIIFSEQSGKGLRLRHIYPISLYDFERE